MEPVLIRRAPCGLVLNREPRPRALFHNPELQKVMDQMAPGLEAHRQKMIDYWEDFQAEKKVKERGNGKY